MSKSWSRPTRYLVLVMLVGAAVWFIIYARELVESLAIAAILAFFLNPLVTFVSDRIHVSRFWTVLMVYLISISALITLAILFAPIIPQQAGNLTKQLQVIIEEVQADYFTVPFEILGFTVDLRPFQSELPRFDLETFINPDIILSALRATSANAGWFVVILVTTFYLLKDWERLKEWIFGLVPPDYFGDANRLYYEIQSVWHGYFRGQFRLSIIVAVLTGVGLAAIGLPGAVIFGIAAGILDVILSVGPTLVAIVAAMVALFSGSNIFLDMSEVFFAAIVLGVFALIQGIENLWLRPRIMSNNVNIHPAIVFIAIVASLALAGVLTALFIVPVLASIGVLLRYLYCRVFEIEPWPELVVPNPNGRSSAKKKDGKTAVDEATPKAQS